MPVIAWWNVAGVGGKDASLASTDAVTGVHGGLLLVVERHKPDLIILGETLTDFPSNYANKAAPAGYQVLGINNKFAQYSGRYSKKYAVYFKPGFYQAADAHLICDLHSYKFNRPSLAVIGHYGQACKHLVAAMHCVSGKQTGVPQRAQMTSTVKESVNRFKLKPDLMIGDFNIDAGDRAKLDKVDNKFRTDKVSGFAWLIPNRATHIHGHILDWAIIKNSIHQPSISVTRPQENLRKSSSSSSDEYDPLKDPENDPFEKSDHWPIAVKW